MANIPDHFAMRQEGTLKGLAGGIANIPTEEYQTSFNKDWLTSSFTGALSDNNPQVKEYQ